LLRFWRRCGGGVAHGRRFQAALQLFRTSVSFFFYVSVFSFSSPPSLLSVCFSFLCFFFMFFSPLGFSLLSVLPLSLLCFFVFLLLPGLSSLPSFPLFFPPLLSAFLASIYRGQGRCFLQLSWGSSRLVGHWARLSRFGGWCAVVGRPLCPVGGLQAREWQAEIQIKAFLSPSSPLRDRGKKMNSVVQNDTVLLFFFFF